MGGQADTREPKPKNGGALRIFLILFAVAAVLAVAAGGALLGGYAWLQARFTEPGPVADVSTGRLPRGAGLITTAEQLQD